MRLHRPRGVSSSTPAVNRGDSEFAPVEQDTVQDPTPTPPTGSAVEVHRLRSSLKAALFGHQAEAMRVDRFVVLEQLGVGGMGVVYGAYDPQLDRKIALKLLKQEQGSEAERARSRLLREAQAMARLSHPNVVQVYQAGIFEGRVFLAMEYVRGCTLREWQQSQSRSWREIIDKYVEAARGLAAAHEAGLVHRDFKPANVLVETGGRVRVTDFGTARSGSIDPDPASEEFEAADIRATASEDEPDSTDANKVTRTIPTKTRSTTNSGAPAWSERMTKTGSMVGTPAYMSPEQHAGGPLDARSDQFSFCIALHEALFDELPFPGTTRASLAASVLAGDVRPPPSGHEVPSRIVRALRRGLSRNPEDRFASMDELIGALHRSRPRLRTLVAVSALVVSGAAWVPTVLLADPPCRIDDNAFADVWSDRNQEDLRQRFAASTQGAASWPTVLTRVNDYIEHWHAASVDACRATHVEHMQSEEALDLRVWCLEQRAAALRVRLGTLHQLTEFDADRMADATKHLPELDSCSNVDLLRDGYRPPDTAAERTQVTELRTRILQAIEPLVVPSDERETDSLRESVLQATDELGATAEELGYEPLVAEAVYARGRALRHFGEPQAAREVLDRVASTAIATRHTMLVVDAWRELAHLSQFDLDDGESARRYLDLALALLTRYDQHGETQIGVLLTKAMVEAIDGDIVAATIAADQAVTQALGEPPGWRRAWLSVLALQTRANVYDVGGQTELALQTGQEALRIAEETLGHEHIQTAHARFNMALFASQVGRDELAERELNRVADAYRRIYPPTSSRHGNLDTLRAEVRLRLGHLEAAKNAARAAVHNADERLSGNEPGRVAPRRTLAYVLVESQEFAEALVALDDIDSIVVGLEVHPDELISHLTLRERALTGLRRLDDALALADRTRSILDDDSLDPGLVAEAWAAHGELYLLRGELVAAVDATTRAQKLFNEIPPRGYRYVSATNELVLADAQHALDLHDHCVELVQAALARFEALPQARGQSMVIRARDWLQATRHIAADHRFVRVGSGNAMVP